MADRVSLPLASRDGSEEEDVDLKDLREDLGKVPKGLREVFARGWERGMDRFKGGVNDGPGSWDTEKGVVTGQGSAKSLDVKRSRFVGRYGGPF